MILLSGFKDEKIVVSSEVSKLKYREHEETFFHLLEQSEKIWGSTLQKQGIFE